MTTAKWSEIEPTKVSLDTLVPTQDTNPIWVEAKRLNPLSSYCGDPYPHVVVVDGIWFISDGHHRIARARLDGVTNLAVRVLHL